MKKIFCILFTFHILLLTIFAQNQLKVLPKYNVYVPEHHYIDIFRNPPFTTNSIFNWQFYQFPFPFGFTDVYFIDLYYGWATHTGYGVARTTDGGITWDTTSFGSSNYMGGVNFINRNTGWVVGIGGTIRKTMNGGVNWIVQDYEFPAVFRKVHFFDENTGFIVGEKNIGIGYVLKTTNSGVNWNEVYVSSINQTGLEDQHWFNALTGWVCGYNTLMKTTNGGLNLTSFYTSIPPTQNGSNWLFGISFTNDSIGWLAAANVDRKNIYKTTNSGLNWFFQDNPVAQYEFSGASHVLFMSPDTGWAAVYYLGVILATTNGGNNWVIDEMANSEFYRFSIYNNSKIWCAGYPGQIWYATIHEPNGGLGQGEKLPAQFKLLQNYPNPFNSETTIKYDLPKDGFVMFKVYDVLGKELYSSTVYRTAGTHQITLDGSNYASGLYFYRIETGSYIETKKMVLVK